MDNPVYMKDQLTHVECLHRGGIFPFFCFAYDVQNSANKQAFLYLKIIFDVLILNLCKAINCNPTNITLGVTPLSGLVGSYFYVSGFRGF